MEASDPSGGSAVKKTKGESDYRMSHLREKVVMCVLWTVCLAALVCLSWNGSVLYNRVTVLEERIAFLEMRSFAVDEILEQLRKGNGETLRTRVNRDTLETYSRNTRDIGECNCPAGRLILQCFQSAGIYLV